MPPSLHNGVRLDERDRIPDAAASGFTAVNGRTSPRTLKLSGNGSERRHSRAELSPENDRVQDGRPPDRPDGSPTPRPPERDMRLSSPAKRKRSLYDDDEDMYSRRRRSSSPSSEEEEDEDDEDDDDDDLILVDENGEPSGDFATTSRRHVSVSDAGVDALRRDSEAADTSRKGGRADGPQSGQSSNGHGNRTETTRAGVQVDKGKRKRVFSNRTKTGCQTCRRRKKKCDEAKPSCNNCIRGGFVCEGYLLKSTWPKSGAQNNHIPLQSKHGFPEHPGIFPRPAVETYPGPRPPQSLEEARTRPIIVADERPSVHASGSGSGSASSPSPWAAAWPPMSSRAASDYSRAAPPSEALRALQNYQEQNSYQHRQPGPSTMTPIPQPQHLGTPQPITTAQLALQQQQRQSSVVQPAPQSPWPRPPSEKEKMLSGNFYSPYAPLLLNEREKCMAALWRFNNAIGTGANREERMRMLQDVLGIPKPDDKSRSDDSSQPEDKPQSEGRSQSEDRSQPKPMGYLGTDCLIDPPFRCDFGYNVRIGNEVVIQGGCTIEDARTVVIGHRSKLGQNVSIYTSDWSRDPGVRGTASALEVVIEEGVQIGSGVTILPGARIGKGSIVEAGSLVSRETTFRPKSLISGRPATVEEMTWGDSRVVRPSR